MTGVQTCALPICRDPWLGDRRSIEDVLELFPCVGGDYEHLPIGQVVGGGRDGTADHILVERHSCRSEDAPYDRVLGRGHSQRPSFGLRIHGLYCTSKCRTVQDRHTEVLVLRPRPEVRATPVTGANRHANQAPCRETARRAADRVSSRGHHAAAHVHGYSPLPGSGSVTHRDRRRLRPTRGSGTVHRRRRRSPDHRVR